jgi:hypothetical protein
MNWFGGDHEPQITLAAAKLLPRSNSLREFSDAPLITIKATAGEVHSPQRGDDARPLPKTTRLGIR